MATLFHVQAFMHAVADSKQLSRINAALIAFAAVHAAVSLALVHLGGAVGVFIVCYLFCPYAHAVAYGSVFGTGLIAADSINMAIRIAYSGRFIALPAKPGEAAALLRAALPTRLSALSLLSAFLITGLSQEEAGAHTVAHTTQQHLIYDSVARLCRLQ